MYRNAKLFFKHQIDEINFVKNKIDESFDKATHMILESTGDLIVIGIGKTGIIGSKIAATLTSTGTRAIFVNAAEAIHGDLGMINHKDLVILISYSGNTSETVDLLPYLKDRNCQIIAITGRKNSILGQGSDVVLDVGVCNEGDLYGIVPMASTSVTLMMGDALANELMVRKGITLNDFAYNHPGGSIGRNLLTQVKDIMNVDIPYVKETDKLNQILKTVSDFKIGMTLVRDMNEVPIGIITDGDIRRGLRKVEKVNEIIASQIMTRNFIVVNDVEKARVALEIMKERKITSLIVLGKNNDICGILTINQLLMFSEE